MIEKLEYLEALAIENADKIEPLRKVKDDWGDLHILDSVEIVYDCSCNGFCGGNWRYEGCSCNGFCGGNYRKDLAMN